MRHIDPLAKSALDDIVPKRLSNCETMQFKKSRVRLSLDIAQCIV